MITNPDRAQSSIRALVVEMDPATREALFKALSHKGYDISMCDSLPQGEATFNRQPLVVTHANGNVDELRNFVRHVRQQSGDEQPYILAVGEPDSPSGESTHMLGLNDFLPIPLDYHKLTNRLEAITQWLARRGYVVPAAQPSLPDHPSPTDLPATPAPSRASIAIEPRPVKNGHPGIPQLVQLPRALSIPANKTAKPAISAAEPSAPPASPPEATAPDATAKEAPVPAPAPAPAVTPAAAPAAATPPAAENGEAPLPVLLDHVPLALAMFDREMRYLAANKRFLTDFGLAGEPVTGHSHYEIFPDLHESWRTLFDQALAGRAGHIPEDLFQRPDGSKDFVRWDVRPWRARDGSVGGVILSQEVITPRVKQDRQQRLEKNLAASLLESTSTPLLLVDLEGTIQRSSPAARSLLGLNPTAAAGRTKLWDAWPDADAPAEKAAFLAHAASFKADGNFAFAPGPISIPSARHLGDACLAWSAAPHLSHRGETEGILLTGALSTQPAPAPEAEPPAPAPAPESAREAALEKITDHLPFGLVLLDRSGQILHFNKSHAILAGSSFDAEDPSFENWLARACPDDSSRDAVTREWRESVWRRQLTRTFTLVNDQGILREIEFRPNLLEDGSLLVTLTDVSEARRSEDALRASETKFRALFAECPVAAALADRTGALVEVNPAFEALVGLSRFDLRRGTLEQLIHLEDATTHSSVLGSMARGERPTPPVEVRIKAKSGDLVRVRLTAGVVKNHTGAPAFTSYFFAECPEPAPVAEKPAVQPEPEAAPQPAQPSPFAPAASPASLSTVPLDLLPTAPLASPPHRLEPDFRRAAFESFPHPVILCDLRGRITDLNPAAVRHFGYEAETLVGSGLYRLFDPGDPAGFSRRISDHINTSRRWRTEITCTRQDGTASRVEVDLFPIRSQETSPPSVCLLCLVMPLGTSLPATAAPAPTHSAPLSTIPRDVRHALRNHLQLLGSLLRLQQRKITDPEARQQIKASENRVRAIGLLEEEILRGNDPASLDFAVLARHLGGLASENARNESRVAVDFASQSFSAATVLPLSMILNELLTAATLRSPGGTVSVGLAQESGDDAGWRLSVSLTPASGQALGSEETDLEIARLLAEQLKGHLHVEGDSESAYHLTFRPV